MPDFTLWPPKPTLLDPLAEHDELISERLSRVLKRTI